jgi:hypothetical protein
MCYLASCSKQELKDIAPKTEEQAGPTPAVQARMDAYQKIMGSTATIKFVPGQRDVFAEDFKSDKDVQEYLGHLRDYLSGKKLKQPITEYYLKALRPEVRSRVEASIKLMQAANPSMQAANPSAIGGSSKTDDILLPTVVVTGHAEPSYQYPGSAGGNISSDGTTSLTYGGGAGGGGGGGGGGTGSPGGTGGGGIPSEPELPYDYGGYEKPGVNGIVSFIVYDNRAGLHIPITVTVSYTNGQVTNVNIRTTGANIVASNISGGSYGYNSSTGTYTFTIYFYYSSTEGNITFNSPTAIIGGSFHPEVNVSTKVDATIR